jgi:hypothetical protein
MEKTYCIRTSQSLCSAFRQTDVIKFSFFDESSECSYSIFDGYFWVYTCAFIEVEFLGPAQLLVDQIYTPSKIFRSRICKEVMET